MAVRKLSLPLFTRKDHSLAARATLHLPPTSPAKARTLVQRHSGYFPVTGM